MTDDDLIESHRWRPLRLLLDAMDNDIASLYDEAGLAGIRPRFAAPLIQLGRRGPLTIQELATAVEVTHSAMSQTAAAMRAAGLVESAEHPTGRTRRIRLTAQGQAALPFVEAEWRATEAAVRALEAEIPYPLSQVVDDIRAVLARRSFRLRLADHLASIHKGRRR